MNITKFFFSFLLIIICCENSFSEVTDNPIKEILEQVPHSETFSEKQIKLIQEELKLQSLILEGVEQIKISQGQFQNINQASTFTRDIILRSTLVQYSITDEVQKQKVSELIKQTFTPGELKNNLTKLQDVFKRFLKWQGHSVTSTARTQGLVYALVKFVSIQLDTTVPLIVMGTGNFAAGITLATAPVSPIALFPFKVLKETVKNLVLLKRLGIKESFKQAKLYFQIKKSFSGSVIGHLELINAKFQGQQYLLNIQKESFLNRFVFSKRYSTSINYDNVLEFMKQFHSFDDFVLKLENSRIPKHLKLYTMITVIEKFDDEGIKLTFLDKFKESVSPTSNVRIPSAHRQWVLSIAHATNFEAVYQHLIKMPEGLNPQIFDNIWRRYIIPTMAENLEGGANLKHFQVFRKMLAVYDNELRTTFSTSTKAEINLTQREHFINKMFLAMEKINPCEFIYLPRGAL